MFNELSEKIKQISTPCKEGFLLRVKIVANSKQNSYEFADAAEYQLKLKISKPAVDGKANEEIIKYVSEILNLPKNKVSIAKGEKSSYKALLLRF